MYIGDGYDDQLSMKWLAICTFVMTDELMLPW